MKTFLLNTAAALIIMMGIRYFIPPVIMSMANGFAGSYGATAETLNESFYNERAPGITKTGSGNPEQVYAMPRYAGDNRYGQWNLMSIVRNILNDPEFFHVVSKAFGGVSNFETGRTGAEYLRSMSGDRGAIAVPVSLTYDDYSTNAYTGNMSPSSPYSGLEYFDDAVEPEDQETYKKTDDGDSGQLKLQGTLIGANGNKAALISGETFSEGDRLGKYELVEIQTNRVVFRADDGSGFALGM